MCSPTCSIRNWNDSRGKNVMALCIIKMSSFYQMSYLNMNEKRPSKFITQNFYFNSLLTLRKLKGQRITRMSCSLGAEHAVVQIRIFQKDVGFCQCAPCYSKTNVIFVNINFSQVIRRFSFHNACSKCLVTRICKARNLCGLTMSFHFARLGSAWIIHWALFSFAH